MNRWLMVAVVGIFVTGCAAGVEDPQPGPTPDPEQKDPPAQTFSGELQEANPYAGVQGFGGDAKNLPPRQKPPVPGLKNAEQEE